MSNILYREIVWTFRWLMTDLPYRLTRKGPMSLIIRRGSRKQMTKNKVLATVWTWLRGR